MTLLTLLNQQMPPGSKGRGVDPRATDDRRPGPKLPVTKYNFWVISQQCLVSQKERGIGYSTRSRCTKECARVAGPQVGVRCRVL